MVKNTFLFNFLMIFLVSKILLSSTTGNDIPRNMLSKKKKGKRLKFF